MALYGDYAGDNVCPIYADFEVVLCYWYVGRSFCCNYTGDCVCCNQKLEVFAAHTQVAVSAANMWVTIFVVIIQMEVSAIMQVVFSAVHQAVSIVIMQVSLFLQPCR